MSDNAAFVHRPVFGDYLVAALILAASLASLVLLADTPAQGRGTVQIHVDNRVVRTLSLRDSGRFSLPLDKGSVELEISDGRIRVLESECPRHMCEHRGWIAAPGETIVCLPRKLVVEIVRDGGAAEFDAIAY